MENERIELKCIFGLICIIFAGALCSPLIILLSKSFIGASGRLSLENYVSVLHNEEFILSLQHSFAISGLEALITVVLAFLLAYGLHYTRLPGWFKSAVQVLLILPMFLPTFTHWASRDLLRSFWGSSCFLFMVLAVFLFHTSFTRCRRLLFYFTTLLNMSISILSSCHRLWEIRRCGPFM